MDGVEEKPMPSLGPAIAHQVALAVNRRPACAWPSFCRRPVTPANRRPPQVRGNTLGLPFTLFNLLLGQRRIPISRKRSFRLAASQATTIYVRPNLPASYPNLASVGAIPTDHRNTR